MQSAHTQDILHSITTETLEQNTNATTQHGILHRDLSAIPLTHDDVGDGVDSESTGTRFHSEPTRFVDTERDFEEGARLILSHTSPHDKITEYENALASSPHTPNHGPLFEVVKKRRSSNDKHSPISDLPNGMFHRASFPRSLLPSPMQDINDR